MHTFDVEMQGKLGYTCVVSVIAESVRQAEYLAQRRFPELELTENTRDMGKVE